MSIRRLGKVVRVTKSGRFIVEAEIVPHLYTEVYDDKLNIIGRVFDIMGPVSSPYVSVEPIHERRIKPESMIGRYTYIRVFAKIKGKGRKRGS